MRQIKFRAWDPEVKGMISWQDLLDVYDLERVFEGNFEFVLEQFTGLKDKNGKEIYEGDIVKIDEELVKYSVSGEIREVYFSCGGFRLKPFYDKQDRGHWLEDGEFVEVIGNKFENPELVKDETD